MVTSHQLLQQFLHDDRHDVRQVRVWYTDRGAPVNMSMAEGPDISLEPLSLNIRTHSGEKSVPYHHILVISYTGPLYLRTGRSGGAEI